MALKNNTWKLNQWYDQSVAGNVSYSGVAGFYTMGENGYGQLGHNDKVGRSSPTQIPGTTWDGDNINITGNRSMARRTDGTLWVWGSAGWGKLGLNAESVDQSSPTQIPGTTWSSIMDMNDGSYVSGALKTDGTLWMWGRNSYGALGQNEAYGPGLKGYSSPVQIPGTTWSSGSCDGYISAAIRTDGTLWAWGYNEWGAMAQNNTSSDYSSPVQIPGTTWAAVSAANEFMVIKTDGTLWTWGKNEYGQMGNNDGGTGKGLSSPTQIPGTTWQSGHGKFTAFAGAMGAVKSDGTLWVWGANDNGKLGINEGTPGRRSSPTQIPGTWSAIEMGTQHTLATKTDGTLWSWGYNVWGELGVNNRTTYSSPVQVPGSWKGQMTVGTYVSGVIGNI